MNTPTRLALFVVAVLFAAVEMKAQESINAVRPRVVTPVAQEKQAPSLPTASVSGIMGAPSAAALP